MVAYISQLGSVSQRFRIPHQLWTKGSDTCPHIGDIHLQTVSAFAEVKTQNRFEGMAFKGQQLTLAISQPLVRPTASPS